MLLTLANTDNPKASLCMISECITAFPHSRGSTKPYTNLRIADIHSSRFTNLCENLPKVGLS